MPYAAAQLSAQLLKHYAPAVHAHGWWLPTHSFLGFSLTLEVGPTAVIRRIRYTVLRLLEIFYEWRFGIVSDKEILASQLGITDLSCHDYMATSYLRFRQMMKYIDIRPDEDIFLDFGSGMGRAVILAATYPFRKVIGVELVASLHVKAQKNVQRALGRLRCRDIELHNIDARDFRVPHDVTVIYMWNPFSGEVLRKVIANIRQSIIEAPRIITIVHLSPTNPTDLDAMKETLPWLHESKRLSLGSKSHAVIYMCGEPELANDEAPELAEASEV